MAMSVEVAMGYYKVFLIFMNSLATMECFLCVHILWTPTHN